MPVISSDTLRRVLQRPAQVLRYGCHGLLQDRLRHLQVAGAGGAAVEPVGVFHQGRYAVVPDVVQDVRYGRGQLLVQDFIAGQQLREAVLKIGIGNRQSCNAEH